MNDKIPDYRKIMSKYRKYVGIVILVLVLFSLISCDESLLKNGKKSSLRIPSPTHRAEFGIDTIFNSDNLILIRLSPHVFQHISYLNTNDFGRVECNGMIVLNDRQAVIFDTPTNDAGSEELINFLTQKLKSKIIAVITTHFHEDCVGGIQVVNLYQIPAYACNRTIELLKKNGNKYAGYFKGFDDSLSFDLGDKKVIARFFGEGHTKDNIIGYFPADSILFGGCLVKELSAGKGFIGDANVDEWPLTVAKIKRAYPQIKMVVPGHGKSGGTNLFGYTESLFR